MNLGKEMKGPFFGLERKLFSDSEIEAIANSVAVKLSKQMGRSQ